MTVLYTDDFESYVDYAVPSGWVNATGENGWKVRDASAYAVSGTKAMLAVGMSDSYACVYKGIAARQSVDYLIKQKAKFKTTELLLQRVLHTGPTESGYLGSSAYRVQFTSTASSVAASLTRWDGNTYTSELAAGNRSWSVAADDIINIRLLVDGLNVSVWVWDASNESMPSSAMMTYTDSTQRDAGYLAIELNNGAGTTLTSFDDVTISDVSAGGASASFTITTEDATISGSGEVRPMASFAVTSASATFSGSAYTGSSKASISATAGDSTFSGSAVGDVTQGVITTPALKNNTGTVLVNETGITVYVYTPDTGALVVKKTGQTTNVSGVLTVADALITASTLYRIVIALSSGAEGMDKVTAS